VTFVGSSLFGVVIGCPANSTTEITVNSTTEQINEYVNLNISPTQIWTAVFANGLTFNNVLVTAGGVDDVFVIFFTGCTDYTTLTYPVTLTTTI